MECKSVEGDAPDPALGRLFSDLVRLETVLWDLVDGRLRHDHDLALSWFEPMQVIEATANCRAIDISAALSITIGGVSKLVDRIEAAGLCLRSPHPDDGRSSAIELTRAGRELLAVAGRSLDDELARLFGESLSKHDLRRFAAGIHSIRDHLAQLREGTQP